MSTVASFECRVRVTDGGFINVFIRCGENEWTPTSTGYEMEDLIGSIHDIHWLTASQKSEVSQLIRQKWRDYESENATPSVPLHVLRDQCDFEENKPYMDSWSWAEFVLILGCLALSILLVWMISKSDVGASWGW